VAGKHDLYRGSEEVHVEGYLTDVLTDKAVEFIERQQSSPFFLSLHYTAPHWPWETRSDGPEAKRIKSIVHTDGGSVGTYVEMIRQMDEGIGRVLDAIRRAEAERDTFVVFSSDNGGERFSDNWPLTGKKMDLLEGGIRVPYIARWPGRIPAGETTSKLAITMDWAATFLELAGVSPHSDYPLDGINLLSDERNRALFWRMKFRDQKAVRHGSWKWISIEGNEFLFDLSRDARERANMAGRAPEQFDLLRAMYRDWEAGMPGIPEDAKVSVIYGPKTMAQPS
jgi:arylsulfatase A-like enzyme